MNIEIGIITDRLVLRPLRMDDIEAFKLGFEKSLPPMNRFDEGGFETDFITEEWLGKLLLRRKEEADRDYSYMLNIFRKSDGASLGYCNITPHYREDFQYARIGYTLHNIYWGNGYATEAIRAMVKIGFEQLRLHRLEAHVNLDNPASKRALQKAGFEFECIRRGFILEDGIWTDNEIYFINNDDWDE